MADAVKRHGGFIQFRIIMGHELIQKDKGFWNEQTIMTDLTKIINEIGHFPVYQELKDIKRYDLIRAINRNGGYIHFRKLMM